MNVLFVSSRNMIAPNLAYRLKQEGHTVKLYLPTPETRRNFDGLVEKIEDWQKELDWVGKDGLIIFDDVGEGKTQEELRERGYSVFGGCAAGDRLENDRAHAQKILHEHGLQTLEIKTFNNLAEAIAFVKEHNGPWVIKQNGHSSKSLNYVSMFDDGRDVINVLENYARIPKYRLRTITLQRRVQGIEIGVGRYFNGRDWVGPIEMNIEHKKLFPDDLGPPTSEMGTLAWYDDDEKNNKLFQDTLARLKPYLEKINYRGDIDLNCIVNQSGAFPLEITPRFGSPAVHLQDEIHRSPWGEFLKAVADGRDYSLHWQAGYGLVVMLTVPPFPYTKKLKEFAPDGLQIYFDESLSPDDFEHIHFEEVSREPRAGQTSQYYISGSLGYVMYVTGLGHTVTEAQAKTYGLIKKIRIPKMFYRSDIGERFVAESSQLLKRLGYGIDAVKPIKKSPVRALKRARTGRWFQRQSKPR